MKNEYLVKSAVYGGTDVDTPNKSKAKDVSNELQMHLNAGHVKLCISNGLPSPNPKVLPYPPFNDPAKGLGKAFAAIVSINKTDHYFACNEGQTIDFSIFSDTSDNIITYEFNKYNLVLQVELGTTNSKKLPDSGGKSQGFNILNGTISFTDKDKNKTARKYSIPPSSVGVYNTIWASAKDGAGGSCMGIDTFGMSWNSTSAKLSWQQENNRFLFQGGTINDPDVLLIKTKNYPPKAK
jgi:hypothetical protein